MKWTYRKAKLLLVFIFNKMLSLHIVLKINWENAFIEYEYQHKTLVIKSMIF